jgi:arabinoxylan arabinofuranohydrolase
MVVRTVMVTVQPTHNDAVHVSAAARSAYATMPFGSVLPGMHKFRFLPDWCGTCRPVRVTASASATVDGEPVSASLEAQYAPRARG